MGQFWLFVLWVKTISSETLEKLIDLCKKEKTLFLQIETFGISSLKPIFIWEKKIQKWYYKKFITPYTAIIDLEKSIDEILSDMKQKWRYNIRLAEKKWVKVYEAEKNSQNLDIFYKLMLETTSRDKFLGNKKDYYKHFLDTIPWSSLIFTKYGDKILSAWIFVFDKNISIYYYGASTSDKRYRNLMAPYLMQWFAIKKAKDLGSKYYDFLWVSSPDEKNSSLAWVTNFKMKLTSDIRKVSDSYIYKKNTFMYNIFMFFKKVKWYIK